VRRREGLRATREREGEGKVLMGGGGGGAIRNGNRTDGVNGFCCVRYRTRTQIYDFDLYLSPN
jgi:hypothetical protein